MVKMCIEPIKPDAKSLNPQRIFSEMDVVNWIGFIDCRIPRQFIGHEEENEQMENNNFNSRFNSNN